MHCFQRTVFEKKIKFLFLKNKKQKFSFLQLSENFVEIRPVCSHKTAIKFE